MGQVPKTWLRVPTSNRPGPVGAVGGLGAGRVAVGTVSTQLRIDPIVVDVRAQGPTRYTYRAVCGLCDVQL